MRTRSRTTVAAVATFLAVTVTAAVVAGSGGAAAAPGPGSGGAGPPGTPATPAGVSATTREAAAGLPGHTVYRPADLHRVPPRSLPVVVYGNGACASSNLPAVSFLTGLASRGYVVVANGALDAFPVPSSPETTTAHPEDLVAAALWATGSSEARAQLQNRVDPTRVGVLGHSCGGVEALAAGVHPIVDAVAGFNTGYSPEPRFGGYGRDLLAELHSPVLLVDGGPTDVAFQNSADNHALLDVPAVRASNATAGHVALVSGEQSLTGWQIAADWFDLVLRGDEAAGATFTGPDCGLCTQPGWTVESTGFPL